MSQEYIRMDLTVNNHPGVMSHVCGLFVRRGCNVEGIMCAPVDMGETSVIRLYVHDNGRMRQIAQHAGQLEDVLRVEVHSGREEELVDIARMMGRERMLSPEAAAGKRP